MITEERKEELKRYKELESETMYLEISIKVADVISKDDAGRPTVVWVEVESGVPPEPQAVELSAEMVDRTLQFKTNIEGKRAQLAALIEEMERLPPPETGEEQAFCEGIDCSHYGKEMMRYSNILEAARPDMKTGRKVRAAASMGGRIRADEWNVSPEDIRTELAEYMNDNPNVSRTESRKRVAKRFGVSSKTVMRHTKEMFTK